MAAPDPFPRAILSEGALLQRTQAANERGITGAGVRVGVVSTGVTSLADSQSRGELPPVRVLNPGNGDEGTAMLEIVHDLAPGAELLFHTAGNDIVDVANAYMRLADAGSNVIANDIGFLTEPVFERGMLAAVADAIAAGGVSFHSSAGNEGAKHVARVAAIGTGKGPDGNSGPFSDCGAFAPTNTVAIAPDGKTTFDVQLGRSTTFILQWSEPRATFPTAGQGAFTDLDLYLMDASGTRCLARSTGAQGNAKGDAMEVIALDPDLAGQPGKLVVNVHGSFGAAAPPILDLVWQGSTQAVDPPTRAGSLAPSENYMGDALSVGAVRADGSTADLESFSSAGPIEFGLTTLGDGTHGPGPHPIAAPAPSFAAADRVSISGAGGFPSSRGCPAKENGGCRFPGTSAAAPHSAACAALILQVLGPQTPVAEVNRRLRMTATRNPQAPNDPALGAGVIDCLAASTLAK